MTCITVDNGYVRITRTAGTAVALAAAVLCLAACSAQSPSIVKSGHYFAVVDKPGQVTADALIRGVLDVDDRGCWILRNDNQLSVMMWPSGTTLSGKKISLPGVRGLLGVGTAIQGAGGGGNPSKVTYSP